jgi:hypothetical protein
LVAPEVCGGLAKADGSGTSVPPRLALTVYVSRGASCSVIARCLTGLHRDTSYYFADSGSRWNIPHWFSELRAAQAEVSETRLKIWFSPHTLVQIPAADMAFFGYWKFAGTGSDSGTEFTSSDLLPSVHPGNIIPRSHRTLLRTFYCQCRRPTLLLRLPRTGWELAPSRYGEKMASANGYTSAVRGGCLRRWSGGWRGYHLLKRLAAALCTISAICVLPLRFQIRRGHRIRRCPI